MMKSLALLPRRADLTRTQFRDYYETRHATLAIRYFAFAKYVRNHLADHDDIGFDTISEFWSADIVRLAGLMQTEVGDILRADESRFMDRPEIRSGAATETLVAGAPRGLDRLPRVKHAWLLRREPALDAAALASAATELGRAAATAAGAACERVTLDVIAPWPGAAFPFDAVLWFWMRSGAAPIPPGVPARVTCWRAVTVTTCETPPEVMAAALQAQAAAPR